MLIHRIPGVFNYCDSWCDRCRMQQACEVYHEVRGMEDGLTIDHDQPTQAWHASFDVPTPTPEDLAQYAAEQQQRDALTDQHPLAQIAATYYHEIRDWRFLRNPSCPPADPVVGLAWQSIDALSLTVEVKARRAVHALIDRDNDEEWCDDTLDPRRVQTDGNGTAKLLRLILRELLDAWRVVAADPDETGGNPAAMMKLLQDLDHALAAAFPYAMEFVRPGFDE